MKSNLKCKIIEIGQGSEVKLTYHLAGREIQEYVWGTWGLTTPSLSPEYHFMRVVKQDKLYISLNENWPLVHGWDAQKYLQHI